MGNQQEAFGGASLYPSDGLTLVNNPSRGYSPKFNVVKLVNFLKKKIRGVVY